MTRRNIEIRPLTTIKDLEKMQEVESAVWKMDPIPVHQTYTSMQNGGIILGAFAEGELVGFLNSFPGFKQQTVHLCSHMLGILPDYQQDGIGERMKRRQAALARQAGYSLITWTFDPLESRNAHLNLHKLGAVGTMYRPNHYGSLQDEFNQGLPSDRILIEWYLRDRKQKQSYAFNWNKLLLEVDEEQRPVATKVEEQVDLAMANVFFVAIPKHFQQIKQRDFELATEWRRKTRTIFEQLFLAGFNATDLLADEERSVCYYVFTK